MTLRELFQTIFQPTCVSVARFRDNQTEPPAIGIVKHGGIYSMELEPYIDETVIAIEVKWETNCIEIVTAPIGRK